MHWTQLQLLQWLCEMRVPKQQYKKDDGRQFYQFVQSFPEEDNVTPLEVHQIGLELAQKLFPDFEVMVVTHCNTKHPHNHIEVNSVSFKTGKKLHQNHDTLMEQRLINDQSCMAHGLKSSVIISDKTPSELEKGVRFVKVAYR